MTTSMALMICGSIYFAGAATATNDTFRLPGVFISTAFMITAAFYEIYS